MIFNRQWYEKYKGRDELDEYRAHFTRLSQSERTELIEFASSRNPATYAAGLRELPENIRRVAHFYLPIPKEREVEIWHAQRALLKAERSAVINLTSEEIIEDAGLDDEGNAVAPNPQRRKRAKEAA